MFGPSSVASIGRRFGRSVAVASSKGLCILDLAKMRQTRLVRSIPTPSRESLRPLPCIGSVGVRPGDGCSYKISKKTRLLKWRMFANEHEESQLSVHAMTWWERNGKSDDGNDEDVSHDLLFAVVDTSNSAANRENGQLRLVCWSRRR